MNVHVVLVDDNLALHEVEEPLTVEPWMNSRNTLTIRDIRFVLVLNHLVKVEVLEVVNDAYVVDESAVIAQEAISILPVVFEVSADDW